MNPLVCMKCKVEFVCKKNGTVLRHNREWCRAGDEYLCPGCGARVLLVPPAAKEYSDKSDIGRFFDVNFSHRD
jgi:DNA-directed RNA polymerase subunit RPC12/RpoP